MRTLIVCLLCVASLVSGKLAQACEGEAFTALKQLAGDWEIARDGAPFGELHMRSTAGGCALIEAWIGADGTTATAMHWPEPVTKDDGETEHVLKQVYVDSTGWFIHAQARLARENVLVYEGETVRDEKALRLRATLHGLGTDAIVHINDVSEDDGATWRRTSTFKYRRITNSD